MLGSFALGKIQIPSVTDNPGFIQKPLTPTASEKLYTYIIIKVIFKVYICWSRIRCSTNILPPFFFKVASGVTIITYRPPARFRNHVHER